MRPRVPQTEGGSQPLWTTDRRFTDGRVRAVSEGRWGPLRDELEIDVRRVAERLRGLSQTRLAGAAPPFTSRAVAARLAAQRLAEAAQGLADRAGEDEPAWRALPDLSDFAAGDLVAVTGQNLLEEIDSCPLEDSVWVPGGRRTARDVVSDAAGTLAATRRLL